MAICAVITCAVTSRQQVVLPACRAHRLNASALGSIAAVRFAALAVRHPKLALAKQAIHRKGHGRVTAALQEELGFRAGTTKSQGVANVQRVSEWLRSIGSSSERLMSLNYSVVIGILGVCAACAAAKVAQSYDLGLQSTVLTSLARISDVYSAAVERDPIVFKASISGATYALGDLTAQIHEGRCAAEFDGERVLRAALVGFIGHGPMSHVYYQCCDDVCSRLQIDNEVITVLGKVFVDQTLWAATWNACYVLLLGCMKAEDACVVWRTCFETSRDSLQSGWRLWPFVHLITYSIIPQRDRVLWVNAVDLCWTTVLAVYSRQLSHQSELPYHVDLIQYHEDQAGDSLVLDKDSGVRSS